MKEVWVIGYNPNLPDKTKQEETQPVFVGASWLLQLLLLYLLSYDGYLEFIRGFLLSCPVGCSDRTQIIRHGGKHDYLVSYLTGPLDACFWYWFFSLSLVLYLNKILLFWSIHK